MSAFWFLTEDVLADQLLRHGDRHFVRQVQVVEKSSFPLAHVLADQADERLDMKYFMVSISAAVIIQQLPLLSNKAVIVSSAKMS